MKPRLASIEQKNGLLKATVGKGVDKSENILRSWNNVLNMLEDHKSVMKDQTTILQERIEKDIKLFANDVEKFEARWLQARPSEARLDELSVAQIKQVSETVRSKREDLDGIVARRNEIMYASRLIKETDVIEKTSIFVNTPRACFYFENESSEILVDFINY
jgi:hypothetical protein